jgi:hypothetical protein
MKGHHAMLVNDWGLGGGNCSQQLRNLKYISCTPLFCLLLLAVGGQDWTWLSRCGLCWGLL